MQSRSLAAAIKDSVAGAAVPMPPSKGRHGSPTGRRPGDASALGGFAPVPPSGGPMPPPGGRGRGRRPQPKFAGGGGAEGAAVQTPSLRQMLMSSELSGATPSAAPQTELDGVAPATSEQPVIAQAEGAVAVDDGHCSIVVDLAQGQSTEIRTKVFRMGAPLLRSTIPVQLGTPRQREARESDAYPNTAVDDGESDAGSNAETILSLSELGVDDIGSLSVTFDFPC